MKVQEDDSTFLYQFNRHQLAWQFGYFKFNDAMSDICSKVGRRIAYVKGLEKLQFFQKYLFAVGELHMVHSFKKLHECPSDWCEHRHGKNCARRKVHELKNYIDKYHIILHD